MTNPENYDEEVWQWVLTSLGPEGRAKLYGECVAANLVPPRRWWRFDSIVEAAHWFAVPALVIGERRQVLVLGSPRRRVNDG